jgi:hypothetical protein
MKSYIQRNKIVVSQKARAKKRPLAQETDDLDTGAASADFDDDFPSACEFSQMSRPERKRHREKKRRNQVNAGFDELKALLLRIDPETIDRGDEINRVDLIGRAVMVMRKLKNDNEELRRQRKEQQSKECHAHNSDDLVTMAVPYLVPKEHHYIPPAPLHHSTPHHAPPQPPQHHHHLHPDDPPQPYHLHPHHQYQYPPPHQGPSHASSTASSSSQHQSHRAPHHYPYHHQEGPSGHHPYYGDGYS